MNWGFPAVFFLCQPTPPSTVRVFFPFSVISQWIRIFAEVGEECPLWTAGPQEISWFSPPGPPMSFPVSHSFLTLWSQLQPVADRRRFRAQLALFIPSALSGNSFQLQVHREREFYQGKRQRMEWHSFRISVSCFYVFVLSCFLSPTPRRENSQSGSFTKSFFGNLMKMAGGDSRLRTSLANGGEMTKPPGPQLHIRIKRNMKKFLWKQNLKKIIIMAELERMVWSSFGLCWKTGMCVKRIRKVFLYSVLLYLETPGAVKVLCAPTSFP